MAAFGQWDPDCGTVDCPGGPTETYDYESQCGCQDVAGAAISCDAGDGAGDECVGIEAECETACADAENDDEFTECVYACLQHEGC